MDGFGFYYVLRSIFETFAEPEKAYQKQQNYFHERYIQLLVLTERL